LFASSAGKEFIFCARAARGAAKWDGEGPPFLPWEVSFGEEGGAGAVEAVLEAEEELAEGALNVVAGDGGRLEPVVGGAHLLVDGAGGAGDVGAGRLMAEEHVAGVGDFGAVDHFEEAVLEGVAAEVAPEVAAAAEVFAVPIDLRLVPELAAERHFVVGAKLLGIGGARGGGQAGLGEDAFDVAHGGEIRIPGEFEFQFHAELAGQFLGAGDFVLVMAEDDELPGELGEGAAVLGLELVDLADVSDHALVVAPDAVLGVAFLAGAIDGAGDGGDAIFDERFEDFLGDVVEVGAVGDVEGDVFLEGVAEDLQELGIEEDFAVIGDFDFADARVGPEEAAKGVEAKDAAADHGVDGLGGGGAGGTAQLAAGGGLQPDVGGRDERFHAGWRRVSWVDESGGTGRTGEQVVTSPNW
jgi:hypothetical protein